MKPDLPRHQPAPLRWLGGVLVLLLLLVTLAPLPPVGGFAPGPPGRWDQALLSAVLAGPVDWQEVPASPQGRQWWDSGSLRRDRQGRLSVLSRFQPAPGPDQDKDGTLLQRPGTLYVMDLDCGQELYRDRAVNGLPRWGAPWALATGDPLTEATLRAACAAAEAPHG